MFIDRKTDFTRNGCYPYPPIPQCQKPPPYNAYNWTDDGRSPEWMPPEYYRALFDGPCQQHDFGPQLRQRPATGPQGGDKDLDRQPLPRRDDPSVYQHLLEASAAGRRGGVQGQGATCSVASVCSDGPRSTARPIPRRHRPRSPTPGTSSRWCTDPATSGSPSTWDGRRAETPSPATSSGTTLRTSRRSAGPGRASSSTTCRHGESAPLARRGPLSAPHRGSAGRRRHGWLPSCGHSEGPPKRAFSTFNH